MMKILYHTIRGLKKKDMYKDDINYEPETENIFGK